jgi:hypothetical protein
VVYWQSSGICSLCALARRNRALKKWNRVSPLIAITRRGWLFYRAKRTMSPVGTAPTWHSVSNQWGAAADRGDRLVRRLVHPWQVAVLSGRNWVPLRMVVTASPFSSNAQQGSKSLNVPSVSCSKPEPFRLTLKI